ncbi:2-dehydropantoate 2-reductase [Ramlibacter terrae]|uniref:2-dehydropantoate 2-reductase n=1 Tax=Ramlibacter terrae TaxID=2732511 RepID=A0ABX6P2C6_9BURK|nr:2-dehydropantoate 2-reductase [Ramlibacter terrae]
MKVAVVGAGAIGGLVGAKLALAGEDVTCIVRGANLDAIRAAGLRLLLPDGSEQVAREVRATEDCATAGPQDVVVIAVKAHQLPDLAPRLAPLIGPDTCIVPMQNGVPWWYFHRHGGKLEGTVLRSVDPEGALGRRLPPEQVIGCVVYPASELEAPGVVRHVEGNRLPLGEPDGSRSERVARVADAFTRAGFKAPVLDDIRGEIWLKLWGNLTFNPISALGHATLADICRYPATRELASSMMQEAAAVAGQLGVHFRVTLDQRIAGAEKVGHHKTSMLQDIEAGRAPEIDALVGSVLELARLTATPTPHIAAVHALVKLLSHTMAQGRGYVRLQTLTA